MDFETRAVDRNTLRFFAEMIRKNFEIKTIEFPVLKFLENLIFISKDCCDYIVEEDEKFENGVMAYLDYVEGENNYHIHIRESVYKNAYNDDHASLGFIMHEISHYLLISIFGLKPINTFLAYSTKQIPTYASAEWQAMAFCGEIMIPYEECKNMSYNEIYYFTKSSKKQTEYFLNKVVKK